MRIALFTSNQPRHIALAERLSTLSDDVTVIFECNTVFPGEVQDFFNKSDVMQSYFKQVMAAEQHYFGHRRLTPKNIRVMPIKSGDLNRLSQDDLKEVISADVIVVFGSSFIKGWLADVLVEKQTINIHMGTSPYYRGSSCNFWAVYDGNPAMVGATIHLLSKGLDSGPILLHAVPKFAGEDPFLFTMKAVVTAFDGLEALIQDPGWRGSPAVGQDKSLEIRYTRNSDFTDAVAFDFLNRKITSKQLDQMFSSSLNPTLIHSTYCP